MSKNPALTWLDSLFLLSLLPGALTSLNIVQRHALWLFRIRVDGPCSAGRVTKAFPVCEKRKTEKRLCVTLTCIYRFTLVCNTQLYMYGPIVWISCILIVYYISRVYCSTSFISEYQVQYISISYQYIHVLHIISSLSQDNKNTSIFLFCNRMNRSTWKHC